MREEQNGTAAEVLVILFHFKTSHLRFGRLAALQGNSLLTATAFGTLGRNEAGYDTLCFMLALQKKFTTLISDQIVSAVPLSHSLSLMRTHIRTHTHTPSHVLLQNTVRCMHSKSLWAFDCFARDCNEARRDRCAPL